MELGWRVWIGISDTSVFYFFYSRQNMDIHDMDSLAESQLAELSLLMNDIYTSSSAAATSAAPEDDGFDRDVRRKLPMQDDGELPCGRPPVPLRPSASDADITRQPRAVHQPHPWGAEPHQPHPWESDPAERLPREHDAESLLRTIAIKDNLLRQMEDSLLLPPPDQLAIRGLGRRAAALVANARRREAVLALKLRASTRELDNFRKREDRAVELNRGLRRRLQHTQADMNALTLRREARTACMHARTTHTRTHIHTYTHTHIHTCTHTCAHTHIHTCAHAHIHTYTHAHMHTCR